MSRGSNKINELVSSKPLCIGATVLMIFIYFHSHLVPICFGICMYLHTSNNVLNMPCCFSDICQDFLIPDWFGSCSIEVCQE